MKLDMINANIENFGPNNVIAINFRIALDHPIDQVYLDADRTVDFDSFQYDGDDRDAIESAVEEWVDSNAENISKLISDAVFGSNDFTCDKQLFRTWLNGWGVLKFIGSDGECAVAVCHATDDVLRIDRKAKVFSNEADYVAWYDQMTVDFHWGDAGSVQRAILDIESCNPASSTKTQGEHHG